MSDKLENIKRLIDSGEYTFVKKMLLGDYHLYSSLINEDFIPLIGKIKAEKTDNNGIIREYISHNELWLICINYTTRNIMIKLLKNKGMVGRAFMGAINMTYHDDFTMRIRKQHKRLIELCL